MRWLSAHSGVGVDVLLTCGSVCLLLTIASPNRLTVLLCSGKVSKDKGKIEDQLDRLQKLRELEENSVYGQEEELLKLITTTTKK
jgi:hypothetical protein